LRTLDGLKKSNKLTSLSKRMENVFRNNTFTKIKGIIPSKISSNSYNLFVDGIGYCSGTSFIYVKSKSDPRSLKPEYSVIDFNNETYEVERDMDYNLTCKRNKF
ncbi:hypothetical protein LCGC14_1431590, partial [marine sediment metagenome]